MNSLTYTALHRCYRHSPPSKQLPAPWAHLNCFSDSCTCSLLTHCIRGGRAVARASPEHMEQQSSCRLTPRTNTWEELWGLSPPKQGKDRRNGEWRKELISHRCLLTCQTAITTDQSPKGSRHHVSKVPPSPYQRTPLVNIPPAP